MKHPKDLSIEYFDYVLPDERIAKYPLERRDASKLLLYRKGQLAQSHFYHLPDFLASQHMLVMNDTRVIPARLMFKKETGGQVEVFCLDPVHQSHDAAMASRSECIWECMVGGARKWKNDPLHKTVEVRGISLVLTAEKLEHRSEVFVIRFTWDDPSVSFSEILDHAGEIPLPPYFGREAEALDYERYQTVFARYEGSVAAPTAALHFTEKVLADLEQNGVALRRITLHVGAGTFKPVSATTMAQHEMHAEIFSVSTDFLRELILTDKTVVVVGTTTTRTLESLYWMGVKMLEGKFEGAPELFLDQWECYELPEHYSVEDALNALIAYCEERGLNAVTGATSLLIAPGYRYRICRGLITNFHLPKSTLILLVAAFIGDDWRKAYEYALAEDFRFLSYGDSSLLLP